MLLHIGNTAARWTTVNPWVVALGLLLFMAVACLVWRPRCVNRFARRAARPAMAAVVALAILPSILPFDHLLPAPASHAAEHGAAAIHASHCHVSPGSCADAPVAAGLGQFLATDPLLVVPALLLSAIILTIPLMAGVTTTPLTRPPLAS